ncbi:hypothetical protein M0804_000496 [Polistes exclamans]|nr:hypothetical protein M0804_000496 [Polistes exclamans]
MATTAVNRSVEFDYDNEDELDEDEDEDEDEDDGHGWLKCPSMVFVQRHAGRLNEFGLLAQRVMDKVKRAVGDVR